MNELLHLLSVNTTFFTILGYPMSYIEFFGTIFNLACVYLLVRKNIWNWPIGIVGVVLFGILFYQLHLYADLFEQWYYFVTGFVGWYAWAHSRKPRDTDEDIVVKRNSLKANLFWLIVIGIFTAFFTWVMSNVNIWLPTLFPEPAALPFLDVLTTVMSLVAQLLMIQKRLENWILWIIVDVIAIGLYWYKGVPFVALLYVVFLVLACMGLRTWFKTYRKERHENDEEGTDNREVLATT
jgi:nicotinamide mononucleotide transporter